VIFQTHVTERLAALVDGQLSPGETARANGHLAGCERCRTALEAVRFSASLLERLPVVQAPPSIWSSIEAALDQSPRPQVEIVREQRVPFWQSLVLAPRAWVAAAVLLVALAGVVAWRVTQQTNSWDVARVEAGGEARMSIGEWIETTATSSARIRIGQIGTVDMGPNTRMRLLTARSDEHRLSLARGSISAEISAPPRLFFVETPASTVVDLGCAYTMDVDEAGVGVLRVTSGWASLEWEGRESIVPAGASCATRPEIGPGTPSFDEASDRLKQALASFDFAGGGAGALTIVLSEARDRDTLTLWHLLSRVDAVDRARVFDRIVELAPLPAGVSRDKALALDPATLKLWREELAWGW
jgi:anti-sigma factor RsiW